MITSFISKPNAKFLVNRFLRYSLLLFYFQYITRTWVVMNSLMGDLPEHTFHLEGNYYLIVLKDYLIEATIGFLIVMALVMAILFFPKRWQSWLFTACLVVVIPFSFFLFAHFILFGAPPTIGVYFAVFTTHTLEVGEFLETYLTPYFILGMIVYLVAPFVLLFFTKRILIEPKWVLGAVSILPLTLLTLFAAGRIRSYHFKMAYEQILGFPIVRAWWVFQEERTKMERFSKKERLFQKIERERIHQANETYVIVIGESTSRARMQLYGYNRLTNPTLNAFRDSLFLFEQVETSHPHTLQALNNALTFAEKNKDALLYEAGSLVDIYNQAGFRTYWLSNQPPRARWDTPIIEIARCAQITFFTRFDKMEHDGSLFLPFQKSLADTVSKKMIFLHLMGTHWDFEHRYPPKFSYFDGKRPKDKPWLNEDQLSFYNQYDNAIRYNDFVVRQFLKQVGNIQGAVCLLYFSDHGMEIHDRGELHGRFPNSPFVMEVPFFFWGNDAFFRECPSLKEKLERQLGKPYNTELLPHFWQDMTDVYTEYYDSTKSLLKLP